VKNVFKVLNGRQHFLEGGVYHIYSAGSAAFISGVYFKENAVITFK